MLSVADFWFCVFWKRIFFVCLYYPEGESFWAILFPSENVPFHFSWGTDFLSVFEGESVWVYLVSYLHVPEGESFWVFHVSILRIVHLDFPECESFWVFHVFIWTFHCSDGESYIKFFSCFEIHIFFQQQPIDFFIRHRILDLSANRNFTAMSAEVEAEAMAKAEQMAADVYFLDKKMWHMFSRDFCMFFDLYEISISQGHKEDWAWRCRGIFPFLMTW